MRRSAPLSGAAALLFVQACSTGSRAPESAPPGITGDVEAISCEGLEETLIAAPPTRAGLRSAFGAPDSVIVRTEPNRHVQGVTDSILVVHYPGLIASMRRPGGGSDMADHVRITSARYVRHASLAPGASAPVVMRVLGEPTRRADDASLVYDCNMGADQPVTFHLRDGRVHSITIDYYVD